METATNGLEILAKAVFAARRRPLPRKVFLFPFMVIALLVLSTGNTFAHGGGLGSSGCSVAALLLV
jgi:hypothetical protein